MRAGRMDRLVTIQRETSTRDSEGSVIKTWSSWKQVWAEVVPVRGDEAMSFSQRVGIQLIQVTTRNVDGLLPTDRLSYDGKYWNINYIRELGRKAGVQLMAEVFT